MISFIKTTTCDFTVCAKRKRRANFVCAPQRDFFSLPRMKANSEEFAFTRTRICGHSAVWISVSIPTPIPRRIPISIWLLDNHDRRRRLSLLDTLPARHRGRNGVCPTPKNHTEQTSPSRWQKVLHRGVCLRNRSGSRNRHRRGGVCDGVHRGPRFRCTPSLHQRSRRLLCL